MNYRGRTMAIDPADTSDARLPDDLQFLAEQLWDDAENLARTYPANAPRNWRRAFAASLTEKAAPAKGEKTATGDRTGPAIFGGVVAAAIMAVMAVGWYTADARAPRGTAEGANSSESSPGRSKPVIAAGAVLIPGLDTASIPSPRQQPSPPRFPVPVDIEAFNNLSEPEQEAVIDALHEIQAPEPNLQF